MNPDAFSAMGMPTLTTDELIAYYQQAAREASKVEGHQGHYLKWADSDGAQIWLQINAQGQLEGALPFFEGESQLAACLNQHLRDPEHSALEGYFQGWINPDADYQGEFPFVFQAINIGCLSRWELPLVTELKLSAFAYQVHCFDSLEAFENNKPQADINAEHFLPSGLFHVDGTPRKEPLPEGILSGRVVKARTLTNPLSGETYHWGLLATQGGEVDILIPSTMAPSLSPEMIVVGQFWLCGYILDPKGKP